MDEAHKAVGDYAYCKVVQYLADRGAKFRLLGLSATPGTSIQAIQQVIHTLAIHRVECRTDEDVKSYVQDVQNEVVIVPQLDATRHVQRRLDDDLLQPVLDRLRNGKCMNLVGNATVTLYCLFKAKESYEARPDRS